MYIAENKIEITDTENVYRIRCNQAVELKNKALYIKDENEYNAVLNELEKLKKNFENKK